MSFHNSIARLRAGLSAANALMLLVVVPFAGGCVSRAAPFDALDKAPAKVLRLQSQQQVQPTPQPTTPLLPGLPPEIQALGQQALQGLQQYIPPGLIPGFPPSGGQTLPGMPPPRLYQGQWVIVDEQPLMDEEIKGQLLDIFGSEDSFNDQRGNCFFPGMAVSFQAQPAPVDVVISLSCNQAVGYGFQWPHPNSGFTPDTHADLTGIYQRLFGTPPPPQG
jgi:hypothetical protein